MSSSVDNISGDIIQHSLDLVFDMHALAPLLHDRHHFALPEGWIMATIQQLTYTAPTTALDVLAIPLTKVLSYLGKTSREQLKW
jgi:hypothetical protein